MAAAVIPRAVVASFGPRDLATVDTGSFAIEAHDNDRSG
jgi:hypothetical protein